MLAKRCDRCYNFYFSYKEHGAEYNSIKRCYTNEFGQIKKEDLTPKDLCPSCMEEFYEWFTKEEEKYTKGS